MPRRWPAAAHPMARPGLRPEYSAGYYAAFVRDPEGNKIEAVTFTAGAALNPAHTRPATGGFIAFSGSATLCTASVSIGRMSSTRSATR